MREIKFRLIKDGAIVGYEKHTQNKGNFKSSIFHSVINDNCIGYDWNNINYYTEKFIDHDSKEQYTGLKDKNGVDIYEGDIVTGYYLNGDVDYRKKSAVEWGSTIDSDGSNNCKTVGWVVANGSSLVDLVREGSCEIVGNIHEK